MSRPVITPEEIEVKAQMVDAVMAIPPHLSVGPSPDAAVRHLLTKCIAAALAYLANNPIIPTDEEFADLVKDRSGKGILMEFQRRMFLKKQDLPAEIEVLLTTFSQLSKEDANKRITEAYKLGLKIGGTK